MVLFGSSLGGYLAPRAAAFDERIDGVVYNNRLLRVRELQSACVMLDKRDQDYRAAHGGLFTIGEVRWAQHLLNVPQMHQDIDRGAY